MKLIDQAKKSPKRDDCRIVLHFDHDCFYASVFEKENPALKFVPLEAVQQKQIIVTCNYPARRQGLRKLQLITEAKKICPDVVIVPGEELGKFRDVSKALFEFLKSFSWNGKVERLGFDEVFLDVSDIIDFNQDLLNPHNLKNSYFHLDRHNPTVGFVYDATILSGHQFPEPTDYSPSISPPSANETSLLQRLILGSHLAQHLRLLLESDMGYTSTVGISTSKLLSKLVGSLNKPMSQTVLVPPYNLPQDLDYSFKTNVIRLIDGFDIGKIPGIGFKISQRIRGYILSRPPEHNTGLIYGETQESISVRNLRLYPGMSPELLENILGGHGVERGIGGKIWGLINGIDNSEVQKAKSIPKQISMENSYLHLNTMQEVRKELSMLATNLINRMYIDLLERNKYNKRWAAMPKIIRLSTKIHNSQYPNGNRSRIFNRISKSCSIPNFVFDLERDLDFIVEKLVRETLTPLFRSLHPYTHGWNLSLLNLCVTNIVQYERQDGNTEMNISKMFMQQEKIPMCNQIRYYKQISEGPDDDIIRMNPIVEHKTENTILENPTYQTTENSNSHVSWEESEDEFDNSETCDECGVMMPAFAMIAHKRFHGEE